MGINRYKDAKRCLKSIDNNRENMLIIHYSCEDFNKAKSTPRITSIAVMNYKTYQVNTFSFSLACEELNAEASNDEIEKKLLTDFFDFVRRHGQATWIHWNMSSAMYGFQALEHRYKLLGGDPEDTSHLRKEDLSIIFDDYYGDEYIDDPKISKLLKLNKLNDNEFLDGKEEAASFEKQEYLKIQNSTLRKVKTFAHFLDLASKNKLKTNSKWYKRCGLSIQGIYEYGKDKWWFNVICYTLGIFTSILIESIFK